MLVIIDGWLQWTGQYREKNRDGKNEGARRHRGILHSTGFRLQASVVSNREPRSIREKSPDYKFLRLPFARLANRRRKLALTPVSDS